MALNTIPVTPAIVKGVSCLVSTAQADKTGLTATNLVTLYTATAAASGGNGALIQDVTVTLPSATSAATSACVVCIFKKVGGVRSLLKEIALAIGAGSATAAGITSGKISLNEWLNAGDTIDASTTFTQPTHVTGNVAEY